jgi:hypothetical protein
VGRIRRVNKLSQRVQVVRCRNAPYVEVIGHVPVPSNVFSPARLQHMQA